MAKTKRSKGDLLMEAKKLEKAIEGGKLRGKNLEKARWKVSNLKWRAKRVSNAPRIAKVEVTAKVVKVETKPAKKISSANPYLPGFIEQMPNATIEELGAKIVSEALRAGIEKRVEKYLDNVFAFKKAK